MLNISMQITNQEVFRRFQIKKAYLLADIGSKNNGYFVHSIRRNALHRAILECKIGGRRNRGRQRTMGVENISARDGGGAMSRQT